MKQLIIFCLITVHCNEIHRFGRQIVDGIVKNKGVKPKSPSAKFTLTKAPINDERNVVIGYSPLITKKAIQPSPNEISGHSEQPIDAQAAQHNRILERLALHGLKKLKEILKKGQNSNWSLDSKTKGKERCSNNEIPGKYFTCPLEGYSLNETHCCGFQGKQFCCSSTVSDLFRLHDDRKPKPNNPVDKTPYIAYPLSTVALLIVIAFFLSVLSPRYKFFPLLRTMMSRARPHDGFKELPTRNPDKQRKSSKTVMNLPTSADVEKSFEGTSKVIN